MTVLGTLKKRYSQNARNIFKKTLDQLAIDPTKNLYEILFVPDTS
jgi:hypothetical protein